MHELSKDPPRGGDTSGGAVAPRCLPNALCARLGASSILGRTATREKLSCRLGGDGTVVGEAERSVHRERADCPVAPPCEERNSRALDGGGRGTRCTPDRLPALVPAPTGNPHASRET